ncbi:MAG: hypothetical protein H7Y15_04365 [Pseudonocardia sp.]|nr:hypothetical protein [Pseudonocardia sp.]
MSTYSVSPALADIRVPATVLVGGLDLDAIRDAARRVADEIVGSRLVQWADVDHLPSMERPDDFLARQRGHLTLTL